MSTNTSWMVAMFLLISGCSLQKNFDEKVEDAIMRNPKILSKAIEKNPVLILESLQTASRRAQDELAQSNRKNEEKEFQDSLANPLPYNVRKDEAILGERGAPITIVEYSDFECPFCARSFKTVKQLLEKYQGRIRFIYKHLPLDMHPQAMVSAKYFEAIRLQDEKKAFLFHDAVYSNQKSIHGGKGFLDRIAKDVGADMNRLRRDLLSRAVAERIEEDVSEAARLGINGTPGFLVNGVPVRGAYPYEHFVNVIEELRRRNKLEI